MSNANETVLTPEILADLIPDAAKLQEGSKRRVCMTYQEIEQFANAVLVMGKKACDLHLRSRVADLLHLLEFAIISTPTSGDLAQANKAIIYIENILATQHPIANDAVLGADEREKFDAWIHSTCFQKPPQWAYEFSFESWNEATKQALASQPSAQPSDTPAKLDDWDRISKAAAAACNEYGQWMPERWLQLFVAAYNKE